MTPEQLHNLISQGESETLEFKASFTKAVIETLVAFSNTHGGQVLIGVDDDGYIKGVSITEETVQKWINEIKQSTSPQVVPNIDVLYLNNKVIVNLTVIEFPVKPVSFKERYYKRVLNSNHKLTLSEIANEHLRTINSSWDFYPDTNHSIEHISIDKVENYIRKYENWNDTIVDFGAIEFLEKQEFLRDGKLTFGAYLLFADDLCIISDIQIGRFKSPTKIIDSLDIDTDIFTELDLIIAFIKKHLMVEFIITGNPQREERYDYPLDAIREIVINMLVHRDYRNSSGSIIKIYDDRIEFYNPGGLFGDLTKEKLLNFNYQPQARNKMLAKAFKLIGKVEKYGSGIKRIFTICKIYGVIEPQININNNSFEVILFKEIKNVVDDVVDDVVGDVVDSKLAEIIRLIKLDSRISASKIAKKMNISTRTAQRYIKELRDNNSIIRIGNDKTGHWEVV